MKQIDSPLQPNQPTKSSRIRKLSILAAMLFGALTSRAQTTLISPTVNNGGFESGTSGWTFVQNTSSTTDANAWTVDTVSTPYAGSYAAYITTNASGLPYSYASVLRTSHMYKDVTFPAGENFTLSFQWKAYGETTWDRLLVYLAPTSVTPVSGSPASNTTGATSFTLTGATLLWMQPELSSATGSAYTQANIAITQAQAGNASSSSNMRLIFVWQNDGSVKNDPPASVDNITLTSIAQCASAAIPQYQGFNASTANTFPLCWSTSIVNANTATSRKVAPIISFETASASPTGSSPTEGTRMLRFNSASCNAGSQLRLTSLPVNTTGTSSVEVEFKWLHTNGSSTMDDSVQLQYSLNGTTWTNAGTAVKRYQSTTGWSTKTIQLPAAAGNQSTVHIGFLFTAAGGTNNCHMDDVKIRRTPTCFPPITITAANITPTTASLTWSPPAQGTPVNYDYILSTSSAIPTNSGTGISGSPVNFTSLTPNTTYYAFLRTNCGGGDSSEWSAPITIMTPCVAAALSQSEGFNVSGTTATPICWSTAVVTNTTTAPALTYETSGTNPTASPAEGTRCVKFNSFNCGTGAQIRLVSLPVNTNCAPSVEVEFKWMNDPNTTYMSNMDGVQVQYSLDGITWTNAGSFIQRSDNSITAATWKLKTVQLPAAAGNKSFVYIGFLFTSAFGNNCYLDDVKIRKAQSCFTPTAPTVSNIAHNSATFSWTAPTQGTPANYEYIISTSSTTPTTNGTAVSATSVAFTPSPSTTYYAFVRTYCGGCDYSDWSTPVAFTTPCAPVSMPFLQSFTAGLPSCWSATEAVTNPTVKWATTTADATNGAAGPQTGTHFAFLNVNGAAAANNPYYLNMGPVTLINASNNLSYYYFLGSAGNTSTATPPLEVQISNYSNGPWTTIYTHSTTNSTFASSNSVSNWIKNNVSLTGYNGQNVYVRFKAISNAATTGITNIGVDEVRILPKTPTSNNSVQCGTSVPTASVTSNTAVSNPSFRWYTAAAGGTPIAGQTGATYTGSISATTTWYVSEVVNGNESERVLVTANVNQATTFTQILNHQWVCAGTNVTFTANAVGAGTITYQWQTFDYTNSTWINIINGGQFSGATSNTLSIASVTTTNATLYRCTANSNCGPASTGGAFLNIYGITAVNILTVKDSICTNESITFTASTTNVSNYQWKKNNVNVGSNSPNYTASGLVNGDSFTVIVTSSINCPAFPTATTTKKIYVKPMVPSSVTFSTAYGNGSEGCVGIPLQFTATATNGGSNPVFQWKKNGVNVGTNSNIYIDTTLPSGSVISVTMTSNGNCPSPASSTNSKTITMYPVGLATVYAKASPDTLGCENVSYTFNSHFTNGGPNPKYQWMKNGQALLGDTLATYTPASLSDRDVITVEFRSNKVCVFPVTSVPVTMHLTPELVPGARIYGIPFEGGILFSADLVNGGTNPVLQWRKNGKDITGATGITYHATNLNANDEITLFLVSDMECANPKAISSEKLTHERVTGISNVAKVFNEISLFPNPNEGKFTLRGSFTTAMSNKQASIEVLNSIGQTVYRKTIQVEGKEINVPIELSNSPASGMYMLQLNIDNQKESIRFILKQ